MTFLTQMIPVSLIFMLFLLSSQQKQLLSALLILEMIMVIIMFMVTIFLSKTMTEVFFLMPMLTLAGTEASLGLASLVMMMRSTGSDTLNLLSTHKC